MKKITKPAVFKEKKTNVVNFFTGRYIPKGGGNFAYTFSSTKALFEFEDKTTLMLSVSERKAKKLISEKKGNLTYRGNKFISFDEI